MATKVCKTCGMSRDEDLVTKIGELYFCCPNCIVIYYSGLKQDQVIDEISNKDIMIALKALILAVANPAYVDKTTNQLRAQVTGTVTSSTTVAVSDITLKGGLQPRIEMMANTYSAWALLVRNRIT
jgi:hypothetical protein